MSPLQRGDQPSARHRAPGNRSNSILHYTIVALCVGAAIVLLASGWLFVSYLLKPVDQSEVPVVPQESFVPALPPLSSAAPVPDRQCSDFYDQDDAQKFFEALGGPGRDPAGLDLDKDGRACENYKYNPITESMDK